MVNENKAPLDSVTFDEFAPTTYEMWKEEAVVSLKGAPFEKRLLSKTYEGIMLEPIYTRDHAADYAQRLSFPGAEDYLRGTRGGGYLAQPWAVAQDVAGGSPAETNAALKRELDKGGAGISLHAADCGLNTLDDALAMFDGLCLLKAEMNLFAGASALPLLGLLKARVTKKELGDCNYYGCIGADPIGVYALNGKSEASLEDYYQQMGAAIKWTTQHMPRIRTIFIQGSIYHNAGANAVQEVAAAMSTAIAYVDALQEQGFGVEQIAGQIRFGFSLGANFFMEIAKLRAARMVWAQIVKAYGGGAAAAKLNAAAQTSAFTVTAYDPYVNILRATTQAFSGVVGGVDALNVLPFDRAAGQSDELSRRVARNIQVMMQQEFGLISPMDPAGGSWYIETLTGQLAEAVWAELQKIDAAGGIVAALQAGSLQDDIAAVLAARFKALATRADKAIGCNMYANTLEKPLQRPARAAGQAAPKQALPAIAQSVDQAEQAFLSGACLADVAAALNSGQEAAIKPLAPHRWTEQFEALRAATERHMAAGGENVKVFLCNMGPIPQHKARADFSAGFMEVANFEVLKNDGFANPQEAIAAAQESRAAVAVICSTDETYPELAPVLAQGLKRQCPGIKVILAGAPAAELKPLYDESGVDEYIHVKANCLQILSQIQKERGIC